MPDTPLTPETEGIPSEIAAEGRDAWRHLRAFTSARIALGRAGGSTRTDALLDFRLAHARARDAVQQTFHTGPLLASLAEIGAETFPLATAAADRRTYLLRPDLGRCLAPASRERLTVARAAWGSRDLAIVVSDGLSALATERQVGPLLTALLPLLRDAGWTTFPVFVAPFGRVKLQDEIGATVGARHTLMLLGERPGLGAPDSLGAYFTFEPGPARTDADRNCVSNIRPDGLPPAAAARRLVRLLGESRRLAVSGVRLKDTGDTLPGPEADASSSPG